MLKRCFDILFSSIGILLLSPIMLIVSIMVIVNDRGSPFYVAERVGKNKIHFYMYKLRSMTVDADKTGVESTANDDVRITWIGNYIRKYKLDEISQLYNVFKGDMSLVGPRPNSPKGVSFYTTTEKGLLTVRPGITDFSSIVFSDEGSILDGSLDPDKDYDELIRPWKSKLGLVYIDNISLVLDIKLIFITILAIFSKKRALKYVVNALQNLNAEKDLIVISQRKNPLKPTPLNFN